MRRVSEREPVIRQFVIVKNKLMSFFNIVDPLGCGSAVALWIHSYFDNVMTKLMINNRTDTIFNQSARVFS